MAEELNLCPFCGNDAQVEQKEPELPAKEEWYRVICEYCGSNSGWYMSPRMAIRAWNTRI